MATPELNPVTTMTLLGLLKKKVEYYGEGNKKQGEPVVNQANIRDYTTYKTALDNILKEYGNAENFEKSYFEAKGAEPLPKSVASMAADKRAKALLGQNNRKSRMEEARLQAEARRIPLPPRRPNSAVAKATTPSFAEAGQSGQVEGAGSPFTLQEQAEPSETRQAFSLPPRRESLSPAREPNERRESLLSAREPDGPKQLIPRSVEANKVRLPPRRPDNLKESTSNVRLPPRRPDNLKESTSALVSTNEQGYKKYKKDSAEAQSFRNAYAAAEEGAIFDWDGREYKKY